MATYTIKDLEKLSGIKAHTIRIWEKRFGLIEPLRTSTNIREYMDVHLKKLLNVSMLHRHGFKISKIAKLSPEEMADKINHFLQHSSDESSQIESLSIAMVDLDEEKFEKILSKIIIQMGFEEAVIKIIYPFFVRIGVMWQTGAVSPVQEHFISNLIRQKFIVAIDSQLSSKIPSTKSFLLFLPESELHELGLLFFTYLLKKRNHKVIYLGQSVPLKDVAETLRVFPVDYAVTSFISSLTANNINEFVKQMADMLNGTPLIVTGARTDSLEPALPTNVHVFKSPTVFIHFIDTLR